MKKLMFVAALAGAMTGLCDVTSANCVGYTVNGVATDASLQMYSMMTMPFEAVDGSGISINDLKFENPTYNYQKAQADQILIWLPDQQTYKTYWFYGVKGQEKYVTPEWKNWIGDVPFSKDYKDGLPAGTVFWYLSLANAASMSMTISGAVPSDPHIDFEIARGTTVDNYYFIANPYPTALKLNPADEQVEWGDANYNYQKAQADQILIWLPDQQTYKTYWFYGVKGQEKYVTPEWKNWVGDVLFSKDYKDGLPAGTGFWYLSLKGTAAATQTVRINNPVK